ncbi:MAG: SurA N-terminal domain-containing protein [Smithellaceae bacterium]|nr:SurA N-terminal domain-containing protein [Smithellaceae bacterium]
MKRTFWQNPARQWGLPALLAMLCALCLVSACGWWEAPRPHVATVNGEKIYLEEYQSRLNDHKGLFALRILRDESGKRKRLEEEVLEALITEKIVFQRARELGLSVSRPELETRLLEIRGDYGENFFDLLVRQNVRYEDWREALKKEMLFEKLMAADVREAIRVSDDEAEDYFHAHPDFCKSVARVRASQIVTGDLKQAREVEERLKKGEDFASLATAFSIGPEAVRGGDLGLIVPDTMPEPLDQTLFTMPLHKTSAIIKSAYGYHILKVTDIQQAGGRSFAECRQDILEVLRAQKEEAAFLVWLNQLKMKAVVKKEINVIG